MRHQAEEKLISQGYKVKPNGEIFKFSNSTKSQKKLGQLNETNVFFYGSVPYPYTNNPTFFNEILGTNLEYVPYVPKKEIKEESYTFTLEEYYEATKAKNQFQMFVSKEAGEDEQNKYEIRGVKSGSLTDATLFPYIDVNENFLTAKIVKYNSNTGKRVKTGYSNNWFHAYKQIKEDLDLDLDVKISKKVDCFFGEHLVGHNDNNIVIVESEKTAILISMLFPKLTFIATGSKSKFKNLDKTFLKDRNVFVYPDKDAHLEWLEIANENGWFCSEIINEFGEDKTDIADYLHTELGEKIGEELISIVDRKMLFKVNSDSLEFLVKRKTKDRYCIPNYQTPELVTYTDKAKGNPFSGVNFGIFEDKFDAINANVDFNRWMFVEGEAVQVDESEFLRRLEKAFRVMKYLNKDVSYMKCLDENANGSDVLRAATHIDIFKDVLQHLIEESNFTFNKDYVENVLLPIWDNDENDVSGYWSYRVWRFKGGEVTIEKDDFLKRLYEDIKASKINGYLIKIKPLIADERYINNNDIGLDEKKKEPFIWDLIKKYNKEVLGCTTQNNYDKKLEINEYFEYVASVTNTLENGKVFLNSDTPYYTSIVCQKSGTISTKPPISVIYDNTSIDKKIIRQYMNFESNYSTLLETKVIVSYLLDSPLELSYFREDRRIIAVTKNDYDVMREEVNIALNKIDAPEEYITLEDAFDYDLDFTDSRLNVSEEEVLQSNDNLFRYSWIKFNIGRELTAMEDMDARINSLDFMMSGRFADVEEIKIMEDVIQTPKYEQQDMFQ